MKYSWIDPPSGWKYGFPKAFTFVPSSPNLEHSAYQGEFIDWLEENGYPIRKLGLWNLEHMRYGLDKINEN